MRRIPEKHNCIVSKHQASSIYPNKLAAASETDSSHACAPQTVRRRACSSANPTDFLLQRTHPLIRRESRSPCCWLSPSLVPQHTAARCQPRALACEWTVSRLRPQLFRLLAPVKKIPAPVTLPLRLSRTPCNCLVSDWSLALQAACRSLRLPALLASLCKPDGICRGVLGTPPMPCFCAAHTPVGHPVLIGQREHYIDNIGQT